MCVLIDYDAADIDLATITDRIAVKKAVQSGNIEDAIEKVNDLNPEVSIGFFSSIFLRIRLIMIQSFLAKRWWKLLRFNGVLSEYLQSIWRVAKHISGMFYMHFLFVFALLDGYGYQEGQFLCRFLIQILSCFSVFNGKE